MIGITRGPQRVPNDRGRSWALANFTLPAADVFTFTPTKLPIRLTMQDIQAGPRHGCLRRQISGKMGPVRGSSGVSFRNSAKSCVIVSAPVAITFLECCQDATHWLASGHIDRQLVVPIPVEFESFAEVQTRQPQTGEKMPPCCAGPLLIHVADADQSGMGRSSDHGGVESADSVTADDCRPTLFRCVIHALPLPGILMYYYYIANSQAHFPISLLSSKKNFQ